MRRAAIVLSALVVLAGCSEQPAAAPETAATPTPPAGSRRKEARDDDRGNLVALTNGGAVVSRTAESDLEQSVLHAIDGATFTRWASPTGDANMSAVFSFATRSRVERLGVVASQAATQTPSRILFELSDDGITWQNALTLEPLAGKTAIQPITPTDATYVRVTLVEPAEQISQLRSIVVEGRPLGAAAPPQFGGCWTLNTFPAAIAVEGSRLRGSIADDPSMFLDGGIDGRVARLMWFRGPMWGYALATTAADGKTLSMATFHEEILLGSFGRAWMGARCDESRKPAGGPAVARMLDVAGRWSMFGLVFDPNDALVEDASAETLDALTAYLRTARGRHRIIAREFRETAAEANQKRADTRLASLRAALEARGTDMTRLELTAAGSQSDAIESDHAIMRALSSRIDLERLAN